MEKLKDAAQRWPMTLGWIDCLSRGASLGRGIVFRGRWAEPHEAPPYVPNEPRRLIMPIEAPSWALSRPIVQAFNAVIYGTHPSRVKAQIVDTYRWFYPLDFVKNWNLMYGPR